MKKRYNILNKIVFDYKVALTWWPVTYWFKCFGWKGLFTWCFSFALLKDAYFKYDNKEIKIDKPGFQMCIFGFQFGWLYIYND